MQKLRKTVMNKIIVAGIIAVAAAIGTSVAEGQPPAGCAGVATAPATPHNNSGKWKFEFHPTDTLVKTDDNLVRVSGNLVGEPHTSCRIDSVAVSGSHAVTVACDIDGVDFRRYFQWEDDGTIPLEIDFPGAEKVAAQLRCRHGQLIFYTSKGIIKFPAR